MTIQSTQLAMGFSRAPFAVRPSDKPTCSSCALRFVLTAPDGTWPVGSLRCTKGGFMTQPLARCNHHTTGCAMSHDPAIQRARHAHP